MEKINTAWQAASQEIYAADQAAGAAPNPGTNNTDEGVTDVNYEEVK